jgi:hypothetical protein
MKKLFLVALATFSFLVSLSPAHSQTMDPKVKDQVLRCIRFMIYDEIKVLAHRYLDTASTAPNSINIGQQKITELQAQVKSLCGGTDAPNSLYQQAVEKAKTFENDQVTKLFTTPQQQAEVEKVYQRYGQMGVSGQ